MDTGSTAEVQAGLIMEVVTEAMATTGRQAMDADMVVAVVGDLIGDSKEDTTRVEMNMVVVGRGMVLVVDVMYTMDTDMVGMDMVDMDLVDVDMVDVDTADVDTADVDTVDVDVDMVDVDTVEMTMVDVDMVEDMVDVDMADVDKVDKVDVDKVDMDMVEKTIEGTLLAVTTKAEERKDTNIHGR